MKSTLCIVAAIVFSSASDSVFAEYLEVSGRTMGTHFKVKVDSPPEDLDTARIQSLITDRLTSINLQMSTWDPESELSRFNALESDDWFPVSAELVLVIERAAEIHKLTDGAFDPTVEPLIRLWGFGDNRRKQVPTEEQILSALELVGMQHVETRAEPPALRKSIAGLQINLSAIAKGYAVDQLAELLESEGLTSYVVDIGGENRVGETKQTGAPWKLAVESPLGGHQRILNLTNSSVATSGEYNNFFKMDGVTYSHAIDPKTGRPVEAPPASVSIIHKSCMTADALATAMMVLGVKQGLPIAEDHQISVMFQQVLPENEILETYRGDFEDETVAVKAASAAEPESSQKSMPWFPFAAAAVIFLLAIGGMAIGTIVQNKSLKGSCGGLASMPGSEGKSICELCTIPKDECTNAELREQMQKAATANQSE